MQSFCALTPFPTLFPTPFASASVRAPSGSIFPPPACAAVPRRRPIGSVALLTAALAALVGCTPTVVPTGVLSSYADFDVKNRPNVKVRTGPGYEEWARLGRGPADLLPEGKRVAAEQSPSTRPLVLVIQPVRWTAPAVLDPEKRDILLDTARESFRYWIGHKYPSPVIYRYGLLPNDPLLRRADVIFVESSITDVATGYSWARTPMLAITQLGHVKIQIEGRLRLGSPSGPVIGEFAARSRTSGQPPAGKSDTSAYFNGVLWGLGFHPKMYSNMFCLRYGLNETGFLILKHLPAMVPPPETPETAA